MTTTQFDQKAQALAKEYLTKESELLSVLLEMKQKRLFPELNFTGVFDYCHRKLKFSREQSFYFKSVTEASEKVPELHTAISQGELTLSQARRIAPILTPENKNTWIEKAKMLPQTQLEKEVTVINPKAHTKERIKPLTPALSELKVPVDSETEANLERLKDILSQKLGKAASLADVIAWASKITREKFDPVKKAERSISSGNRKPSSPPAPRPGRHPVPAAVKHQVALRDQGQCTHVGTDGQRCQQKRWLEEHHPWEVAHGGLNTVDNLRTLCSAHHRRHHFIAESTRSYNRPDLPQMR